MKKFLSLLLAATLLVACLTTNATAIIDDLTSTKEKDIEVKINDELHQILTSAKDEKYLYQLS